MANMMPYYGQSMNQPYGYQPCSCSGGVSPYANPYMTTPYASVNKGPLQGTMGAGMGGKSNIGPAAVGKTSVQGSQGGADKPTKVLYKARKESVEQVKKIQDEAKICNQYVNQYVRVETLDGQTYEGYIAGMDPHTLYLQRDESMRYPYPYPYPTYNPYAAVLPLVLYNLLAISLI